MQIKNKVYPCEVPECSWKGSMRSKIKEGEWTGLKACPFHYNCSLKPKKQSFIKPITEKTKAKKQERSVKRNVYFEYHINRCEYSEESLTPISNPSRVNICHIFAKEMHKSLEDNLENYVYLTLDEHTQLDYLLFTNKFDEIAKIFPRSSKLIWKRVDYLLPLCTENTKFKIAVEEYINQIIKQ